MVDFLQLQEIIKKQLAHDRTIKSINVSAATLEDAVSQAAILLDIPVRRLEYEIVEKGSPGFFGSGKKDWTISAYENMGLGLSSEIDDDFYNEVDSAPVIQDLDGDAFVHFTPDGVFLKVIPPSGRGRKATEADAMRIINERETAKADKDIVSRVVRDAKGEYVRVGEFEHRPLNDSIAVVDIVDEEMKAYMTVSPPGYGGCDISVETFISILRNNRVVHGVDEEFLRNFADRPVYKERVPVADGTKPNNGRDAYIHYNFETDQSKVKLREGSNGRIDFKDLNIIKNVVQNQPLAKKVPYEDGTAGRTVTGKAIPARDGRDIPLPLGKNVHVGDDGLTIIADINGQVVLAAGKINVEPIYTVQGDVNLKTGNIIFLGTVVINGNVEDGFTVKAAGNIEVNGTVQKSDLDAEGDIIVHQGITGKNAGFVKAGRSIWARFIENAVIEAGNMVIVSDGIINSQVNANKRIVCQGKRAHIVGGRLRASEEINAKILGSPTSGTDTICEVGFDPSSKIQLEGLIQRKDEMEKKLDEIQLNYNTLVNIKKQRKSLPEDKETYLQDLTEQRKFMLADLAKIKEEITKIQEYLSTIKARGKVSASSKVYPGVKIYIKDAINDIRTEYKAVTFILQNDLIQVTKYEEVDEESLKAPEGYAAY